ncbi:MAG: tRNA (adenosine(37)-N6)-threonylcarbamoyltransferase complex dimerization subunit type 1 TsaB [bacterium]|nr:tRNA (adenosine(37)-N6)-threonylcarbamoyltransferase complex dimerization subunit type 1 TsaB [bacterium]
MTKSDQGSAEPLPILLGIDTTSRFTSLCLSRGAEVLAEYNFLSPDGLSGTLLPAIDTILTHRGFALDTVDAFAVGVGPGLFTGIRMGMAAVKGLLMGSNKPVIPVISLEALATKAPVDSSPVVSVIDAGRKEVYVAAYRPPADEPLLPPELIPADQLPGHLEGIDNPMFIGSGADTYRESLLQHISGRHILGPSAFLAAEMCTVAYRQFLKGNYFTDLQQLMPLYIRKPDAEQNLQRAIQKRNKPQTLPKK